ncbi:MAG: type II secretion system protein GspD [Pirellulaceae bacterium]
MNIRQNRFRRSLPLLLIAFVASILPIPVFAQDDDAALKYRLEKTKRDVSIQDAIESTLPRGLNSVIHPKHTEQSVNGPIYGKDADSFMTQLEDKYDLLVVRQGDTFHVYCPDEQLSESVNYVYMCRRSRASDLVDSLSKGKPHGFPQANPLKGDGRGNFDRHDLATKVGVPPTPTEGDMGTATHYQLTIDNGILLTGPLAEVRAAVKKLKSLDRRTRVVLIEVLIVQYFHDDQFTWRYNLQDGALLKAKPPQFSQGLTQPTLGTNNYGPSPWGIDVQNMAFDPATGAASLAYSGIGTLTSQFRHNLTLLAQEKLARIVTNPHIAVINGQTGQVLLNEKFNFLNAVVTPTGTVSNTAASLDSQTSINVTPTIVGPDSVHVAVNTNLATFSNVSNVDSTLPGQRVNELGTSVILKDDNTLILGGIVKEEVAENRNKIPGFAKIPVVGPLFRGKNQVRRYSETVVYIIPKLFESEDLESRYRDRVFKYSDDQIGLGEEIRARHRTDKHQSDRLYHYNEQLNHLEKKDKHKDMHSGLRGIRNDQEYCPPGEVFTSAAPESREATKSIILQDDPELPQLQPPAPPQARATGSYDRAVSPARYDAPLPVARPGGPAVSQRRRPLGTSSPAPPAESRVAPVRYYQTDPRR